MVYDAKAGYMVLYSGYNVYGIDETWAFANGSWANLTAKAGSPYDYPADGYAMSYDGAMGAVILQADYDEAWAFEGGIWTELNGSSPTGWLWSALFFQNGTDGINIYDFGTPGKKCPVESYSLVGERSWVEVNTTVYSQAACTEYAFGVSQDIAARAIVFFGGINLYNGSVGNSTWELQGQNYSDINTTGDSPPALADASFAYDPTGQYSVLFEGLQGNNDSAETWILTSPLSAMESVNRTNLYTGQSVILSAVPIGGLGPYRYAYSGLPTAACGGNLSAASVVCVPVRTGDYTVTVSVTDSMGRTVQATTSFQVFNPLSVRMLSPSPSPTTVGIPVTYQVNLSGGMAPITVHWELGDGQSANGTNAQGTYGISGNYTVEAWVNDSLGTELNATVREPVNPGLNLTTQIPLEGEVGYPVGFHVDVQGGTPPYAIEWNTGANTTVNGTGPSVMYAEPGTYTVTVRAQDALGARTEGAGIVSVAEGLGLQYFVVTSPVVAGQPMAFGDLVTGGVPPVNLTWQFGDGGTAWGENPTHVYEYPGLFTVKVTAVDGLTGHVTENETVTVGSAIPPTTPGKTNFGGGPSSDEGWYVVGGLAAGAAVVGVALIILLRKRSPT